MITRFLRLIGVLAFSALFAACGGGGGGGGGGPFLDGSPIPGSVSYTSAQLPVYSFNATAGTPYAITLVSTSGDADLMVCGSDLNAGSCDPFIGYSWEYSPAVDTVSFIASADGPVYASPFVFSDSASYTIHASTNHLTVDAAARTAHMYSGSLYFSFDALAGSGYQVEVTPTSGNVNIGAVSTSTNMSSSVGSSTNAGTTPDTVSFVAAASQRYYIRVSGTSVNSTFTIAVHTVPNLPDLTVSISGASSDGANVTVNYTVRNQGVASYTGDVRVDAWANSGTAPTVGAAGDGSFTHSAITLAPNASTTGSIVIPDAGASGTAYAIVDTFNQIAEGNETNNVSAGAAWTEPLVAPQTFTFEDGLVPANAANSGNANWYVDSTRGSGGSAKSLRSGGITHSQTSCVAWNVTTTTTGVSFDYLVSSEGGWDYLRFYIDNVQQNSWSGTAVTTWTTVSFPTTAGVHEFKWCYAKDFSFSSGSDAAWIDNIAFQ